MGGGAGKFQGCAAADAAGGAGYEDCFAGEALGDGCSWGGGRSGHAAEGWSRDEGLGNGVVAEDALEHVFVRW